MCSSGMWTANPAEVSCTEGVALVTGGWSSSEGNSPMEVYGPGGMRIMLGLLPLYRYKHTSVYAGGGSVVVCGGTHDKKSHPFGLFELTFKLDGKRGGEPFSREGRKASF